MAQPTNSDVHVDAALTNISVAHVQNAADFVAGRAFPNLPVSKQSDKYFVYGEDFNRDQAGKRAPNAESEGIGYDLTTATYFADPWAVHMDVPDQVRSNADPAIDPERDAATMVMQTLMVRRERDWVSNFMSGGVWTNDEDGVASSAGTGETIQWSDTTSGDPIGDMRSAKTSVKLACGMAPNTLVVGQEVMDALVDHPDIVDRVKYTAATTNSPSMVNEQTIAALFGLDRVLVSSATYNSAAQGATDSQAFIAGKKALLCYVNPTPSLLSQSAGYTFSWQGYLGQTNPFGIATTRMRIDTRRCTRIEGEMAFDHKVVSADCGYFWDTIVA